MAALVNNSAKVGSAVSGTTLETASFAVGGSNRVLYVLTGSLSSISPVEPSSVKWGGPTGTALTQLGTTLIFSGGNGAASLWRLVAPTVQTATVYASWPSAQDERCCIAVAVQDADQTTPNNTVATATGANTNPTVNATSVSGDLVIDFASIMDTFGNSPYITEGTGQTAIQKFGAGVISLYEDAGSSKKTATGTSTTMGWTKSSTITGWATFAFATNGAAAGANRLNPRIIHHLKQLGAM